MNGHRRDDLANDIDKGHPTLSPEADALAAAISRLSTLSERQTLGVELAGRACRVTSGGVWMQEEDRYLGEFDPAVVDDITRFLTKRRDELRARALRLGDAG